MPVSNKTATIVGAGLVGSLWAVYLKNAGYKVSIFERRPDMRKATTSAGKSINLATSFRGWKALDQVGIGDEIRKIAIPMYGRTMHHVNGTTTYQPYGNNNQAIYSVARGAINAKLMDIAEDSTHAAIHFNHECINADTQQGLLTFKNTQTGQLITHQDDLIFATDGAFSAVRYNGLQKLDQFNYSQTYIPDGYREILLPANPDGSYPLAKETLHIWPRERFMLIALPNFDGSFTCTLFMPFEGHQYCFNNLTDKAKVEAFFEAVFPDFYRLMPQVADAWEDHPLSSLAIIRCYPWTHGKVALMGDAAHATVPFFGQGMNCGFEDCSIMWQLMQQYSSNENGVNTNDWPHIFDHYQNLRKPNGDAMQDLSKQNYIVMRDKVADPDFLLLQKIERRINFLYPQSYFPLYTMVSFTDIAYTTALEKGKAQEAMINKLIKTHHLTPQTNEATIDEIIHNFMGK
ncbi:MAG: FAD-dependent monooxygenase [Sphingobacteriales bacterium]|nr:FAD-dependent monooxygenase [Sphingobacteriales bacterium]MBP9141212.1 FAD-dependent monooxygenase [Chitinophagales bacterium]MDA0199089.1 NAD(P)/FAD-dependent oxidoreductase [Bacteroidota bacterium]MBK6890434.1 FAD-dependent monooxygenase [Sphingobacteriales bacterium]MBK7526513.1 FAD-dependent monooxygenase [Sphingobacteriales bacterium]